MEINTKFYTYQMFLIRMWKVFWYVLGGYVHLMHSKIKQKKRKNIQNKIFKQHVIYRIRTFRSNKERKKKKKVKERLVKEFSNIILFCIY